MSRYPIDDKVAVTINDLSRHACYDLMLRFAPHFLSAEVMGRTVDELRANIQEKYNSGQLHEDEIVDAHRR